MCSLHGTSHHRHAMYFRILSLTMEGNCGLGIALQLRERRVNLRLQAGPEVPKLDGELESVKACTTAMSADRAGTCSMPHLLHYQWVVVRIAIIEEISRQLPQIRPLNKLATQLIYRRRPWRQEVCRTCQHRP